MADPLSSALLRRMAGSVLATFLALLIFGFVLLCASGGAALAPRGMGAVGFGVVFGGLMLLMPPLAIGFAIWRSRVLDPELRAIGLVGSGWMPNLREYHGTIDGRQVDVFFARRGPMLQVTVDANVYTTLGVGVRTTLGSALGALVSEPEVPGAPPSMRGLIVRAREPGWAAGVLANPAVEREVLQLVTDPDSREMRTVAVRPGAIQVTRSYFRVPPQGVTEQVEAMLRLAAAVEAAPPPTLRVEAGALERAGRSGPTRLGLVIVAFVLGGVLLVTLVLAAAMAIVALNHR